MCAQLADNSTLQVKKTHLHQESDEGQKLSTFIIQCVIQLKVQYWRQNLFLLMNIEQSSSQNLNCQIGASLYLWCGPEKIRAQAMHY